MVVNNLNKLNREFYSRDTETVAKELLGKILVHEIDGNRIAGKIVETEAYLGVIDKAAHSYGGRKTPRVEIMYGKAGLSYVFIIYGMYYCFNVVTQKEGIPEAVLIRALEPVNELDIIANERFKKNYKDLTKTQIKNLTNGPGKLCNALKIDKRLNGEDLCNDNLYIEDNNENFNIVTSNRIGIDYSEEAKDFPLRFYIENNKYVSVK
ncbi:DNA-3-methyladenine glycosylase [Clostridiaceae bacterium UIB06]|uniref:Putative 3-methyladenine DNA glycosylase n=1 Tax=Clostridium thailandense TaxID=2794346 RepID=A0A949WUA9_9CLOT|nr:DNA-3-methyladenine glycosylase [Clostridium thailandense]MCH5135893.1 DNA-3-methyladenine glycosylase [Clostridiaceae bacterium UIB06]